MKRGKIDQLYNTARLLALREVVKRAREILYKHPELEEFVMAMGTWFFTVKGKKWDRDDVRGATVGADSLTYQDAYKYAYLQGLAKFIQEYDSQFKLTGEPMRFTKKGKIIRDW